MSYDLVSVLIGSFLVVILSFILSKHGYTVGINYRGKNKLEENKPHIPEIKK